MDSGCECFEPSDLITYRVHNTKNLIKNWSLSSFLKKGLKEFQCVFCEKLFSQAGHLKRHIETVHQCSFCETTFSQLGHLKIHIETVHGGIKNYQCDFCGKSFTESGSLKRHVMSVHENLSDHSKE